MIEFKEIEQSFYLAVLAVILGLFVYFYFYASGFYKKKFIQRIGDEKTKVNYILFERFIGFIFFGVIPLLFVIFILDSDISAFGISSENFLQSLYWTIGLSPILILLSYLNAKKKDNLLEYPQIRTTIWNKKLLIISAVSWVLYLLAYEFMFRGFLLFISERNFGLWPAIILNVAVYSWAHIPKGHKETIGAIPFGLVLCLITLQTGTIWVAFMAHVILALSNEWFSLKAHPDMRFVERK